MPDIEEVKHYLGRQSISVLEFEQLTPTSEAAAEAVGCSVGEIAKSVLVHVGKTPVMVITSGDSRIKSSKLKKAAGLSGKVTFPQADAVFDITGYRPGGVCPFLLPDDLRVLVDKSLKRFEVIYPAAGNDRSAVPLSVAQLLELCRGEEANVCDLPEN